MICLWWWLITFKLFWVENWLILCASCEKCCLLISLKTSNSYNKQKKRQYLSLRTVTCRFVMLNVSVVCVSLRCKNLRYFQLRNVQILGFLLSFVSLPWVPKRDLGKETIELYEACTWKRCIGTFICPCKQSFPTSFRAINGKNSGGQVPIGSFQVNSSYLNSLIWKEAFEGLHI